MDQQPDEFNPGSKNGINSDLQNDIPNIDTIGTPELKPKKETNYSGDIELESLKKEQVYFDEKEQNIQKREEKVSTLETKEKEDLKTNAEIENYEMISTDDESSSGVGSDSNSSTEIIFEMNSKSKGEQEENPKIDDFSRPASVDSNTEKITSDPKEIPLEDKTTEKFPPKVLDGKLNEAEAKPTCNEAISKSIDQDNPVTKKENGPAQEGIRLMPNLPYRNSANPFEVVVPFVGKKPDWGDVKPPAHCYDLARKMNKMKFEQEDVPEMSYHEMMKKRQARSKEEVEREEQQELCIAANVADYVARNVLVRILIQMRKDEPNEDAIIRYLERFLDAPVSPIAMLYIPQFVHTVMYIRGSPFFSRRVRKMAESCFYRVHVMFPIPAGYNFETVYTSEVKKFLPEGVEGLHDSLMEYDELELSDESEDSAFSDNSETND